MALTGMVALNQAVERAIIWFFSQAGGSAEIAEEDIVAGLRGWFAAWKTCEGLRRLQELGVAVSVSTVRGTYARRCWLIKAESWSRIALDCALPLA